MADASEEVAVNPDAQAAVTDFLDYTEYLPADLIRSLTLIRGLDETYLTNSYSVHDLTQQYATIPSLPSVESRPSPQDLRSSISHHLDLALNARESAYAEATRLFDLADRHHDRLKSIVAKLNALPKPPSRDPTPQPQSTTKTSRSGRKLQNGTARLTLKAPKGPIAAAILSRPRQKRVTVPGEVMPPYDPDEPIASTEPSDWESDSNTPVKPTLKITHPKIPKLKLGLEGSERKSREPREHATYRKPTPPPENAELGSKHRPWTHLTEWEMYKLRKKMKKNHTWSPSPVMIMRELAEKGRGWENYYKAKAAAQAKGVPFNDLPEPPTPAALPVASATPSLKPEVSKPRPTQPATVPKVKPLRKVEKEKEKQKQQEKSREKDKRPQPPKDAASLAAQEAELAANRLQALGSTFKSLFNSTGAGALAALARSPITPAASRPVGRPPADKSSRKRKAEDALAATPSTEPEPQKKKQKVLPKPSPLASIEPKPSTSVTPAPIARIPSLKLNITQPPGTSPATSTPLTPSQPPSANRTSSVVPKQEASSPPPPSTAVRPPSRRSAAASIEPTTQHALRPSRKSSEAPAAQVQKTATADVTPKAEITAAGRRPKRDAPGTVTQSSQDGGVALSQSKRKHKPTKPNKPPSEEAPQAQVRTDKDGNQELIDPDEERYCVCNDVSWGEMICCELDAKCTSRTWFHMECVKLKENPPRTIKWYCPIDRKKLHMGEKTNGLVGRNVR